MVSSVWLSTRATTPTPATLTEPPGLALVQYRLAFESSKVLTIRRDGTVRVCVDQLPELPWATCRWSVVRSVRSRPNVASNAWIRFRATTPSLQRSTSDMASTGSA